MRLGRYAGLIALLALLVHVLALGNGFVWLDHVDVESGAATAPLGALSTLWLKGFGESGFYRPLAALSLSLDAALGPPWVFHLQNLLWHALAAVALAAATLTLSRSRFTAVLAGCVFAVHPVGSPVVNGILFRPELMLAAALFVLLWAHVSNRWAIAAMALLFGGLSKETAFVLGPLLLLVVTLWRRETASRRLFLAEALGLCCALALRLAFAPAWRARGPSLEMGEAVGTRLHGFAKSALQFVLPLEVPVCDALPVVSLLAPGALLGLGVAVGLVALAAGRRGPALLFVVSLLPSLGLLPVPRLWSPHYLYLPLGFFAWLLAEQVQRLPRRARRALAPLLLALAGISFFEAPRFKSDLSLFQPEVEANADCREAQFYLGEAKRERGDLEGAAAAYAQAAAPRRGVVAYADVPAALQNLALVRLTQGRLDEAEEALLRARQYPLPHAAARRLTHNLSVVALRRKDWERVELLLREETARSDALGESLLLRARALHELGRAAESRALLQRLGEQGPR